MNNWKTTLSALGAALMGLLAALAAAPSELGDVSQFIPPEWKAKVFTVAAIAAFLLKVINGAVQKDHDATGGSRLNIVPLLMLGVAIGFTGCVSPRVAQARKDFLDSTDVSLGVEYDGFRASDTITGGRRKVALDVDAKEVVNAFRQQ